MAMSDPVLKPAPATTGLGEKAEKPDVMGAIRQKRGGQPMRQMNSVDVLRQGLADDFPDAAGMEQFLAELARGAQAGAFGLVQIGNTVFIVSKFDESGKPLPPGTASVHLVTNEPVSALAQRIAVFPNSMRELGYRKITTLLEDPSIARLLERVAPQARMKVNVQQTAYDGQPMLRAEIDLL